jgi:hypothetical protein
MEGNWRNVYRIDASEGSGAPAEFSRRFRSLVAFDPEMTGKRKLDAKLIRKQPFAWRAPASSMLRENSGWRKGEA